MSERKKRTPRQAYRQWLRYQRALRDRAVPVDIFVAQHGQRMGFQSYADHYALQQWLRGKRPAQF